MHSQVAEQETTTAEVIRLANEELERVKRHTQLTIHEVTQCDTRCQAQVCAGQAAAREGSTGEIPAGVDR